MSRPPVPRIGRSLAGLTAVAACSAGLLAAPAPASAAPDPARAPGAPRSSGAYPNLAPRPPMGWNNWSYYMCDLDEKVVLDNARALVRTGLARKGYRTVTLDDCWMSRQRDVRGRLVADRAKFPHGMAHLGKQLHELGLKFGIYTDVGTLTCEKFPGSLGHFQQDAEQFARWKVDYVKADGCNVPVTPGHSKEAAFRDLYGQLSRALRDTGRPMTFSVSAPAYFQFDGDSVWHRVIRWSSEVGNLWRGGRDIALQKSTPSAKWASIVRNFRYNSRLAAFQRPGRWNDPDFLLAGAAGLSRQEMQSQMSLWAMMAAPLISSTDLAELPAAARRVLGNERVIAVDQDALGVQGRVVARGDESAVLSKPLKNGDRAIALFNSGSTPRTLSVTARAAGLAEAGSYRLHDLVTGRRAHSGKDIVAREVPPHGTVLYRVTPD
ncbi:glycoside hydrolase family 27 protein [Streptomyces sp. bgisy084]|uniref:glycoside hydrolase family 27 protein n=1 Tax=Streptomyces sp. bgisy084 TaxID=3413777 RepID=UPI003D7026D4